MSAQYRILLDAPYTFAVESGYSRATHCADFRAKAGSGAFSDTWQCPITGVVMLKPSFLTREFGNDFKSLAEWRYQPGFWLESVRAAPSVGTDDTTTPLLLTNIKPVDQNPDLIQIITSVIIKAIEEATTKQDALYWCLESKFDLEPDAGFCITSHGLTDELARKANWFAVQWDDIYIHFSQAGDVSVYKYPGRDLESEPEWVDSFNIASPGELLNRTIQFCFVPIPTLGLALYTSLTPQTLTGTQSNAFEGSTRAHLIEWKARKVGDGYRMFERSPVRVALNPYQRNVIGFASITYPSTGTFTDAIFEPPYTPLVEPTYTTPVLLLTDSGTATAELRKKDDSGVWEPGTDRQARVSVTLTGPGGQRNTPFLFGYHVRWFPVFNTRNTVSVTVYNHQIEQLEWSEDEYVRFEASAKILVDDPAIKAIARRGDTTFELYRSGDDGLTWDFIAGGLASVGEIETETTGHGTHYWVPLTMRDLWQRFEEVNQTIDSAFDGMTLADAIDLVLSASGFPPLLNRPAAALSTKIPNPKGAKGWEFAPKPSDSGEEILNTFLFLLRRQWQEWRMVANWFTGIWFLQEKPRSTALPWHLVTEGAITSPAAGVVRYESFEPQPFPPEANVVRIDGNTDAQGKGERVPAPPLKNVASFSNPASGDYLGRIKMVSWTALGISDKNEVMKIARRVYDAVAHRRDKAKVVLPDYWSGIIPMGWVHVYDSAGALEMSAWVKRRTVEVGEAGHETVTLLLDTEWAGELPK